MDTVGDPEQYQKKLFAAFHGKIEFVVEKKADATYRTVSAASICAKVGEWVGGGGSWGGLSTTHIARVCKSPSPAHHHALIHTRIRIRIRIRTHAHAPQVLRDVEVENWRFTEPGMNLPIDFGSGYPSDPRTKAWMEAYRDNVFGYGNIMRFR